MNNSVQTHPGGVSAGDAPLLRAKLAAVRHKLLTVTTGTGVALVLISAVSLLSIGMVIDWFAELPWLGRAVLLAINLGAIGWIVWWQVVRPLQTAPDEDGVALLVEQSQPEFRTRLIASVQLTRPGALRANDSVAMVRVLVAQTEALAGPLNFSRVVSARQFSMGALLAIAVVAVAAIAYQGGRPTTAALLQRALLGNVPLPHKTKVEVLSGNLKIAQGETVVLEARASGIIPPRGRLTIKYDSGQKQEFPILPTGEDRTRFALTIDNVQESFAYTIRLNDDTSAPWTVSVLVRPVVIGIEAQQIYPAYTRLGTTRRAVNDLTLLAGSWLQLAITANKNIATASLRLAGLDREAPLKVNPQNRTMLIGEIAIPQRGLTGFTVQMVDDDGLRSKELALYRIDILPDKPPTLTITYPERKEELVTSRATAIVGFEAHDDFGIARVLFHYKSPAIKGGAEQVVDLDLEGATPKSLRRRHEWNLASLPEPLPDGATIECWLEARDTNDATGPGLTTSDHFWFKVVSDEDKRADVMNRLDDYLSTIGKVAEDQERLSQNLGTVIFGKTK